MLRLLLLLFLSIAQAVEITPLIEPDKLAALGERGATPRVRKIVGHLATASDPAAEVDKAIRAIGWEGTEKGNLTRAAILRNLDIAQKLGCTDAEGIERLKRGKAPTVKRGPYAGELLTVDHIVPRSVAPELENVIANLELMPASVNNKKGNKIGARQLDLMRKFRAAGLLSAEVLK